MRGHFTAGEVSVPPGAKAPAGRYLSLVIDAGTFQAWTSVSAPNRRQSHPPASGQSPISQAMGADRGRQDRRRPSRQKQSPAWTVSEVGLEDLALAYMKQATGRGHRHRHLEVQK